jgi:hypothetical protein
MSYASSDDVLEDALARIAAMVGSTTGTAAGS